MVTSESIRNTLKQDLVEPKDLECLMLKTPLKLVTRSFRTPAIMWFLMIIVYKILLMFLFPRKYAPSENTSLSHHQPVSLLFLKFITTAWG